MHQDFVQLTFAGASLAVEFEVCLRHVYFPAGMWLVYSSSAVLRGFGFSRAG